MIRRANPGSNREAYEIAMDPNAVARLLGETLLLRATPIVQLVTAELSDDDRERIEELERSQQLAEGPPAPAEQPTELTRATEAPTPAPPSRGR